MVSSKDDKRAKEQESSDSRLERLKEKPSWHPQSVQPEEGPAGTGNRIGPR